MDKESISRLGLDYISNIDVESSDEIYDPTTTNHIIVLKLIKQSNVFLSSLWTLFSFKLIAFPLYQSYHF